jgi:hypothetical protein
MRADETAFHLRVDANGLFAGFRDVAAPKSGECPGEGSLDGVDVLVDDVGEDLGGGG